MNIFYFIILMPFLFFLYLQNKVKIYTLLDRSYFDYLFASRYFTMQSLYHFKFLTLFFAVLVSLNLFDIGILLFALFEIWSFKFLEVRAPQNLSKEEFLDHTLDSSIEKYSALIDFDERDFKSEITHKLTKNQNFFLLHLMDFAFLFFYIKYFFDLM